MAEQHLSLRKTILDDLDILFENQLDSEANLMAAFTPENPHDKELYLQKWSAIIQNEAVNMQTILVNEQIAGSVSHFEMFGEVNVSYWIGKPFWGQGVATKALSLFLEKAAERPLFARVAFDNFGSQRVLEKNGFVQISTATGYSNARKEKIEEKIYQLN
jgi:ribosomal-protein-alanine N-acetyltransferase